jgi:hypothetical protein
MNDAILDDFDFGLIRFWINSILDFRFWIAAAPGVGSPSVSAGVGG